MKLLDDPMWEAVKNNPNLSVPFYLSASYAYYELDTPIISDGAFDKLATFMLMKWDRIEHHHKEWITEDDLEAGTMLRRDFPEIVKGATENLIERVTPRRRRKR